MMHAKAFGSEELMVAVTAAGEAGAVIEKYWRDPPSKFQAKHDSHYDLVSEVDELADKAILTVIKAAFPHDSVLSEELNPDVETALADGKRTWIVDPLDGTSGFLFRTDPTAPSVMIALLDETRQCMLSVVFQPITGDWTFALRGQGAFRNGQRVHVPEHVGGLSECWADMNHYGDVGFESERFKQIDAILRSRGGARLVSRMTPHSAIALRLLHPISGGADYNARALALCVHDHNPSKPKQLPWDIIPIQLIIQEAGGMYIDASQLGTETVLNPFHLHGPILVGGRCVVDQVVHALGRIQ